MIDEHARPDLVFFDIGDTLVRPRQPFDELLTEIVRKIDIELPQEAGRGFATHVDARVSQRALERLPFTFPPQESKSFWFETYHEFFAQWMDDDDARLLASMFRERLSSPAGYALFDDAMPALSHLRHTGYRLGIISNWEPWVTDLLDMLDLTSIFDHVVISGVCGMEKPDSRIFAFALAQCGCSPESVVYVGDRPSHDVDPAREVGIRSILVDRDDRFPDHEVWRRITSLSELSNILE